MWDEIIKCKCGHYEYNDNARWLSGGPWCRSCYKEKYQLVTGERYRWGDMDFLPPPSEHQYLVSQERNRNEFRNQKFMS